MNLAIGFDLMSSLGVSRSAVQTWEACGILTPTAIGTAHIYPQHEVDRLLAAKEQVIGDEAPPAWIIRLSAPGIDETGHPTGWEEGRESNVDAARAYWKIAKPDQAVGSALVAAVGPLIVAVWNIEGGVIHPEIGPSGKTELFVSEATPEQRDAYLDKWLPVGRGPVVLRWPRKGLMIRTVTSSYWMM